MKALLPTIFIAIASLLSIQAFSQCTATIQLSSNGRGTYTFNATHLADTSADVKYYWTILSDTTIIYADSVGVQDSFRFDRNGNYQVCLHLSDTACSFDTCKTVTVTDAVYYPMLDSINLWRLIANFCFSVDYHPIPNISRSNCSTWNMIYTDSDTFYNNYLYKNILGSYFNSFPDFIGLIREDTLLRKIYYNAMDGSSEMLLYDFSMQTGDSIHLIIPQCNFFGSGFDTVNYKLDSIINITIPGGSRRAFFLNQHSGGFHTPLVWLESVGNLGEVVHESELQNPEGCGGEQCVYYPYNEIVPSRNITYVSCFSHSNGFVYFDSCAYHQALEIAIQSFGCFVVYDSCSYEWVCGGIDEISYLSSFEISPNPTSQYTIATLEVKQAGNFTFGIYDLQGRRLNAEIKSGLLNEGTHKITISLNGLASGLYIVECRNSSGSSFRKLVVE